MRAVSKEDASVEVTYKKLKTDVFGQNLIKFTFIGTRESYTMTVDTFWTKFDHA